MVVQTFKGITNNIWEYDYLINILSIFYDDGYSTKFTRVLSYLRENFFLHLADKKDIQDAVDKDKEDKSMASIKNNQGTFSSANYEQPKYLLVDFEVNQGKRYTKLESIIIIAAFVASRNSESEDYKLLTFEGDKQKEGKRQKKIKEA